MLIAVLGILLVSGGLYLLTRTSPVWQQLYAIVVQAGALLPAPALERLQFFIGIGALLTGSLLVLLRLFGVVKRI